MTWGVWQRRSTCTTCWMPTNSSSTTMAALPAGLCMCAITANKRKGERRTPMHWLPAGPPYGQSISRRLQQDTIGGLRLEPFAMEQLSVWYVIGYLSATVIVVESMLSLEIRSSDTAAAAASLETKCFSHITHHLFTKVHIWREPTCNIFYRTTNSTPLFYRRSSS